MMKPLIKICGINELKILNELIIIEEIDFIGFIFYQDSLRNVSNNLLQQLKDIGDDVDETYLAAIWLKYNISDKEADFPFGKNKEKNI